MSGTQKAPLNRADSETLQAVRPAIREMLLGIPAFSQLAPEEQQGIANKMVKVAAYLANPEGLLTPAAGEEMLQAARPPLARAQEEDPVTATKRRLAAAPGQVGKDFKAGAVREGVEQFGELVKKVDFPKFVGGLIQNVFQAIVDSSIQQMRAYGELIANVAKTVDEFAQDNITQNNARDWLAGKYPETLGVEVSPISAGFAEGGPEEQTQAPVLAARGDNPEEGLQRVSNDLGLEKPVTDLSEPEEEQRLVIAARLQMARARQQLLASMVMLGINRIVVTDGHIAAKVIFDMRASDMARRQAKASMYDRQREATATRASIGIGGWLSPVEASFTAETSTEHVATVESAVEDVSESKAEIKANLTGEVRVNFKSDYFPMEKMASPQMIAAIQGRSVPLEKPVSGA
jgi:hypothetical protein